MDDGDDYEAGGANASTDSSAGDSSSDVVDVSTDGLTETSELYDTAEGAGDVEAELYDPTPEPETQDLWYGDTSLSDDWKDIDFSRTMNTPYEQSVIREMNEAGVLEVPEVDPNLEAPEFGTPHLPTENNGTIEGDRESGNFSFTPNSQEAREALAQYGRSSVEYVDTEAQFSPFTQHESPFGLLDCEVQIAHMTTSRHNPAWEYGDRRPAGTSHDVNYDIGNFAQADNALVDQAIERNPSLIEGLSPDEIASLRAEMAKEIESWRTSSGLTWHECQDGVTMQLVPTVIHNACRHSGGVSTMRTVQAYGDVRRSY